MDNLNFIQEEDKEAVETYLESVFSRSEKFIDMGIWHGIDKVNLRAWRNNFTTVFAKDGLPKRDMEVMYWDKCEDYFVTAPPSQFQKITAPTDIERMQEEGIVSDIKVVPRTYGVVSSKYNIEDCVYEGTELDGTAFKFREKHIYMFE